MKCTETLLQLNCNSYKNIKFNHELKYLNEDGR